MRGASILTRGCLSKAGLAGQEKVSWFLPILLPIDLNFRVHHVDQQGHCAVEGLPQYGTQCRSLRRIVVRSRPSWIESLGSCWENGYGGEGGIRTHGTVSRTLAFEASTLNRSVTSPHWLQLPS